MSTTFNVRGIRSDFDDESTYVNLNIRNVVDLLDRIGVEFDRECPMGSMLCFDMVQDCERALASFEAKIDHGSEGRDYRASGGCMVHEGARREGHINFRIQQLLDLCRRGLRDIGPLAEVYWA